MFWLGHTTEYEGCTVVGAQKKAEQQAKANAQAAQQQKITMFRNVFSARTDGYQYSVK